MGARVLLVAWKGSSATAWVGPLTAGGYTVLLEDTTGERAWRTAKERGIDVVIIDGQKKPSHGRQTGYALRDTAKTRNIPIIWTNLDQEDVTSVETEVHPDVTLPAPTDAARALDALNELGQRVQWVNGALFDAADDETPPGMVNGAVETVTEVVVTELVEVSLLPAVEAPVVAAPSRARKPAGKAKASAPRKAPARGKTTTRKKVKAKAAAAKSARASKAAPRRAPGKARRRR